MSHPHGTIGRMARQAFRAFRYDEALARGISRARVRGAVAAGRITRLGRGVYATSDGRMETIHDGPTVGWRGGDQA
jgi:hypothetical protein